jgi:NAD+ diphosphatase
VTFGGGGLDRAAHLRANADAMARQADAQFILTWRGKVMMDGDRVLRVGPHHPALKDVTTLRPFLGMADGIPYFAAELTQIAEHDSDALTLDTFLDPSYQRHGATGDALLTELRAAMMRLSPLDAELAATAKGVLGWHQSHRFCARCGAESQPSPGGWQRKCDACGGHHFPRTDPVVIMLITHGNSLLLGRSPGWPDGMYSLLAGFVEPGETLEAAVRREVKEETNVDVGAVRYLASQPWPFPSSLMFGCAGEATSSAITIDPVEIEDALWVTREELLAVFAGQHPQILPARKGAIAHFLMENWLSDRLE